MTHPKLHTNPPGELVSDIKLYFASLNKSEIPEALRVLSLLTGQIAGDVIRKKEESDACVGS